MGILTAVGLGGIGGVYAIGKILDYTPWKTRHEKVNDEKERRIEELQELRREEDRAFQKQRDANQRQFQLELEANRMAFQEHQELRRLQYQQRLQQSSQQFQMELTKLNNNNAQELARFQALAMRETQILVSRENAQNMLQDHLVQNALKDFPLNISPLVLLHNRPHSLSSLLRFTVGNGCPPEDLYKDVKEYENNPEALNIFVAPVYVDSKIKNRKVLSDQIWDTTYQKLESFFTENYNRSSNRPVIFYPTAWNDHFSSGMHASETLHFFLKDMPCIVIEPRFDGADFRLMISAWNIGYGSTEHIRTEFKFQTTIDTALACAAYDRSKKALEIVDEVVMSDAVGLDKSAFLQKETQLKQNVKLFEELKLEERIKNKNMDAINAMGIYNIFQIEPIQDFSSLAELLTAQIGMTLATLADIHHLRSTNAEPQFPKLIQSKYPQLFESLEIKENLYKSYFKVINQLISEESQSSFLADKELAKQLRLIRKEQIIRIGKLLGVENGETVEDRIREYVDNVMGYSNPDYDEVWDYCIQNMMTRDVEFFSKVLNELANKSYQRQLERKLNSLK